MELYLRRITGGRGPCRGKEQWIRFPLKAEEEFGLGRSVEHHVRLLSTHISRNHALLKRTSDGRFCIKDQNSLCGIHVNDTRIAPAEWHSISAGDKVEIGRPDDESVVSAMSIIDRFWYSVEAARPEEVDEKLPGPRAHLSASTIAMMKVKSSKKILPKRSNEVNLSDDPVREADKDLKEFGKEGKSDIGANVSKTQKKILDIPQDNEMERENKRLKLELEEKDTALKEEINAGKHKLEEVQKKIAAELEKNFKSKLEQKEEELEIRLQLEKDIALEQCKVNIEKEEKTLIAVDTMVGTMENELQCSICSELFIVSTTLNCAHTFCEYCITEWKKVKNVCPICREPISTTTRSLVLDNYIEKVIESLSGDRRKVRANMIEERRKQMEIQRNASTPGRGRGARRRGRGRGRGNNRGRGRGNRGRGRGSSYNFAAESSRQYLPEPAVIVVSDNESTDDSDSSNSDDSHRHNPYPYRYRHRNDYLDSDSSMDEDIDVDNHFF